MFVGHYAVALAAKKAAPRAPFGTLFLAAQFLDLLWPAFLLLGIEHVGIAPGNTAFTPLDFYDYPISHSLLTVVGWSVAFALVYWVMTRDSRSSLVLAACVLSHWVLDFVSHRPDMPLAPGVSRYVGLGLWNSVPATIMVELVMFFVGLVLFLSSSKSERQHRARHLVYLHRLCSGDLCGQCTRRTSTECEDTRLVRIVTMVTRDVGVLD
jgi:hypothetical protein